MLYRVRATFKDRPGVLAALAHSCGAAGLNILSLQVFPSHDGVTDELVVSVGPGWSEVGVHDLVVDAGGEQVSVTRCTARSLHDAPTSYLQAAARVAAGRSGVADELHRLLETAPPDVANYAGHDTVEVDHDVIARAVPFTAVERARARAFAELIGTVVPEPATSRSHRRGADPLDDRGTPGGPLGGSLPSAGGPPGYDGSHEGPHVRPTVPEDAAEIAALHTRCSEETLYRRYHAPMTGVIHRRMARRLAAPVGGTALVAQAGPHLVGHAMAVPMDDDHPGTWELGVVVEDAWQRRGVGTSLVRNAARVARTAGADEVVLVTQPGNDAILRTLGRAGFLARITRADSTVRITVDVRLC